MSSVEQGKGPPTAVDAAELWQRLAKVDRPHRVVDFPRNDPETGKPVSQVAIVVLRQSEIMACLVAAETYAREMLKNPTHRDEKSLGYEGLYREAQVCELLLRACKSAEHGIGLPFFLSSAQLRKDLTSDEIAVLFQAYNDWQVESGPIIGAMTPEEMDAWIDKLKEGGSRLPLARLSSEARTDLLMRSVSRLANSATVNSSSGSQGKESLLASSLKTDPVENVPPPVADPV